MSVIACKSYDARWEFASDSLRAHAWTQFKDTKKFSSHAKLYEEGSIIIGSVGLSEDAELLRLFCQTHFPFEAEQRAIVEFFVEFYAWRKDYIGNLRGERKHENSFLLGYQDRVFYINSLFVTEVKTYMAIGAGEDFALAALYLDKSPAEAVRAAIMHSVFCEDPVVSLTKKKTGKE